MQKSDYSFLSKLLHRFALKSSVMEMSFEWEKTLFSNKLTPGLTDSRHVFVSGLARSGTTALLNLLYQTGAYASLLYEDMPFILSPNFQKNLFPMKETKPVKERAHGDGIFIGSKSPEALDEPFWKWALSGEFIKNDRLTIHSPGIKVLDDYKKYVNFILLKNYRGKKLNFLSKNNNNVLRLQALKEAFPGSAFIVTFRNPLQHALSLYNQHKHFSELQKKDKFTLFYMNALGHFEFGLNQKPFFLNQPDDFSRLVSYSKDNINFWLLSWKNYYQYILTNFTDQCYFIAYERLCSSPSEVLDNLFLKLEMEKPEQNIIPFIPKIRNSDEADPGILSECDGLYTKLLEITL